MRWIPAAPTAIRRTATACFWSAFAFRALAALSPPRGSGVADAGALRDPLPRYTLLCPMLDEPDAAPGLVAAIQQLDYPRDLLQVVFLVEAGDDATAAALRTELDARADPPHLVLAEVPDDGPRTKARACRWGLRMATGDLLAVFDAEDEPDPRQLRAAAAAFAAAPPSLAALQARLAIGNAGESVLTSVLAAETRTWFGRVLPFLAALGGPVPLGGTSNHFRIDALRSVDGWDAANVTEDAELGLRLAAAGYRTRMLDSTTTEEGLASIGPWIRQRSRWSKGFLQTWRQLRPGHGLARRLGPRRWAVAQLTIGGSLAIQLLAPLLTLRALLPGRSAAAVRDAAVAHAVYAAMMAGGGRQRSVRGLAAAPAYWMLEGAAAWRGVLQAIRNPGHWEKSPHRAHTAWRNQGSG